MTVLHVHDSDNNNNNGNYNNNKTHDDSPSCAGQKDTTPGYRVTSGITTNRLKMAKYCAEETS